jgi:hypothetical protein
MLSNWSGYGTEDKSTGPPEMEIIKNKNSDARLKIFYGF